MCVHMRQKNRDGKEEKRRGGIGKRRPRERVAGNVSMIYD